MQYLNPVSAFNWSRRFGRFSSLGDAEIVKCECPFNQLPLVHVANADAARQISLNRKVWSKPTWMYRSLSFFGLNLSESTEVREMFGERLISTLLLTQLLPKDPSGKLTGGL
jgi:hypothetical protein